MLSEFSKSKENQTRFSVYIKLILSKFRSTSKLRNILIKACIFHLFENTLFGAENFFSEKNSLCVCVYS